MGDRGGGVNRVLVTIVVVRVVENLCRFPARYPHGRVCAQVTGAVFYVVRAFSLSWERCRF